MNNQPNKPSDPAAEKRKLETRMFRKLRVVKPDGRRMSVHKYESISEDNTVVRLSLRLIVH
jgi:hypothetical protein